MVALNETATLTTPVVEDLDEVEARKAEQVTISMDNIQMGTLNVKCATNLVMRHSSATIIFIMPIKLLTKIRWPLILLNLML